MIDVRRRLARRPARAGLAVVAAGIVLAASLTNPSGNALATRGPLGLVRADVWIHTATYAGLAALFAAALGARRPVALAVAAAGAVAFGAGVELLQAAVPWRSFALADLAANAVGAAASALAWRALSVLRRLPAGPDRAPSQNSSTCGRRSSSSVQAERSCSTRCQ